MLSFEFPFTRQQKRLYATGKLLSTWVKKYPFLFDHQDLKVARNQNSRHFYERLAAIIIYETTGYRSLVENYDCGPRHPLRNAKFAKKVGKTVFDLLMSDSSETPDSFVYKPMERIGSSVRSRGQTTIFVLHN